MRKEHEKQKREEEKKERGNREQMSQSSHREWNTDGESLHSRWLVRLRRRELEQRIDTLGESLNGRFWGGFGQGVSNHIVGTNEFDTIVVVLDFLTDSLGLEIYVTSLGIGAKLLDLIVQAFVVN